MEGDRDGMALEGQSSEQHRHASQGGVIDQDGDRLDSRPAAQEKANEQELELLVLKRRLSTNRQIRLSLWSKATGSGMQRAIADRIRAGDDSKDQRSQASP